MSRALFEAATESPDVSRCLERIRDEGYVVYLLLECQRDHQDAERLPLAPLRPPRPAEPVFRIDNRDLSFLRSVGIDPTRKGKRKRSDGRPAKRESD